MLLRLKVSIYKVKRGTPYILKAPLDYNPYILAIAIRLNHLWFLLLGRRTKALLLLFAGPSFYKTLVTLYD
jgi:hypothetical protein